MAMVVKNNMSAVNTLNTLNKNQSALSKSLAKVSSGMKINSAQDDASGYAISERMRVMIRSLDQANQNTQNGSSLMKVAEGAVSNTVEIIKTLKEKAINAATDTNTEEDRAIIQKEIDQLVDQIDDNALITFNGKYLLDGSKVQSGQATYATFTNQMLAVGTKATTSLTALENRNNEALGILSTDKITASYVRNGETFVTTFDVGEKSLSEVFAALEKLETDTQIFAGSTNASVKAAATGSTSVNSTAAADNSSGVPGIGYGKAQLQARKQVLEDALNVNLPGSVANTYTSLVGAIGKVTVDTSTNKIDTDVDDSYGRANELASVLQEVYASSYTYTASDGTVLNVYLKATDTGVLKLNGQSATTATDTTTFVKSIDDGSTATTETLVSLLNGTELSSNAKTGIENILNNLGKVASIQSGAADLKNRLQTAYDNYNNDQAALKTAKDNQTATQNYYDVVTKALNAVEARDAAFAAKDAAQEQIYNILYGLSHADEGTQAPLNNNVQLGLASTVTKTGTQTATAKVLSTYYDGENSSLSAVAKELTDTIFNYLDKASLDTTTSVSTASTGDFDVLWQNLGYSTNSSTVNTFASGTWKNAASTDLAVDTDGDGAADVSVSGWALDKAGSAGTKFSISDISGTRVLFQSYEDAYKNIHYDGFAADLSKAMGDATTTSGISLLVGKNIGLNTAGAIVTTADGTEGITLTSNIAGLKGQISGITISVADAQGNVRKSVNTALSAWNVSIFASNEAVEDNSLKFHIGAQANQSIAVDIKDMRAAALGLKGDNGKVVSVATQDKANAAINVFENALQKALDMQTTIGAIEARLEYTASNLTTSTENVQAAESTIRDADMAKEMTNYTKNNVLLQAAQSMLAQANQNSSAVLSLLQ